MPYKDLERQKEVQKAWYRSNKEYCAEKQRKRNKKITDWLRAYKKTLKCNRCPESHPACLQFHHKDPTKKDLSIREAMKYHWSIDRLKIEIDKCEVVCANCHFKLHWIDI
jgi:transcription elongation factor Elf1